MAEKEDDLPPPEQRCTRSGAGGWRCKETRLPDHVYCGKHHAYSISSAEKNSKKRRRRGLYSVKDEKNPVLNAFVKSQHVEVAKQEQGFEDSWFIATVVHQSNEANDNKCLVEYRTLEAEDGLNPLREYVHVCHLRPLQPNGVPAFFKPDEVVDAYVKDGWRKGVVKKVIGDSRYSVIFRRTNEEMEFQRLELRLHMEWIDGKWVLASQSQETGIMVQYNVSSPSPNPTSSSARNTDTDTPQTPSGVRAIMLEDVQPISRSTCGWMDPKCMRQTDPKNNAEVIESLKKATKEDKAFHSSPTTVDKNSTESGSHLQLGVLEAEHSKLTGSPKPQTRFHKRPLLGTGLEGIENERESVTKGKRGRPKGSTEKHKKGSSKSPGLSMILRSKGHANESTNKDLMDSLMDCEQAIENPTLPFIKSSKMWEEINSNEVFKLIPQNPHFLPLEKENEELREGFAIGYMMSFAALWEKTSKAKLEESSSSVFKTRLKALMDLESFGFIVQPLRTIIEQMLKIKMIENEEKRKSDELDLQVRVVLEEKKKLEMQLQVLLEEKEKKVSKIVELEKVADEIKLSIEEVNREFQSVVAAPWFG